MKYSKEAKKMMQHARDWYEDIPNEIPNELMLIIEEEGVLVSGKIKVYDSDQKETKYLYPRDLEKVQGQKNV